MKRFSIYSSTFLIACVAILACAPQKQFNAPVIYSLQGSSDANLNTNDRARFVTPIDKTTVRDTIHYIRDSIRIVNDTVHYIIYDRSIRPQQDSIRPEIKVRRATFNRQRRDTVRVKETKALGAYQRKLDSLQRKLDSLLASEMDSTTGLLQKQPNINLNSDSSVSAVITLTESPPLVTYSPIREDSIKRSAEIIQQQLKENDSNLNELQQQLQRTKDSASYYRRLAFAATDNVDTVATKKRWYQNIFRNNKKIKEDEQVINTVQDRELHYDNEIRRMNGEIAALKNRNSGLSDDYSRLQKSLTTNRGSTTRERVIYTDRGGRNNRDYTAQLLILQNELNAMRNQKSNVNAELKRPTDTVYITRSTLQPAATAEQPDSANLSTLQNSVAMLQAQIADLKRSADSSSNWANQPKSAPAAMPSFDPSSFPVVSVYFITGSSQISNDQLARVRPFAQMAKQHSNASIVLRGYTDAVGNMTNNKLLANKRSMAVKNHLSSIYQIPHQRISIDEPVVQNNKPAKSDPLSRRVDLLFR